MSRTSAWVKCVDRWGRRKTKLTLLRGAVDALHWDWWAVAFYVNPNRSLDCYCAICYRAYNFLPSFIFLLASCCFNISIPQYSSSYHTRARYPGVLSFLLSHLSQVSCNVLRTWCLWQFLNDCLENVPLVAYFGVSTRDWRCCSRWFCKQFLSHLLSHLLSHGDCWRSKIQYWWWLFGESSQKVRHFRKNVGLFCVKVACFWEKVAHNRREFSLYCAALWQMWQKKTQNSWYIRAREIVFWVGKMGE